MIPEEKEDEVNLYWDPISQPSRAVKTIVDKALGDNYTLQHVQLFKGEHKLPEFLEKNPMGQVPALVVNGKAMNESGSILRYLGARYELHDLYPSDLTARHKIDMMLDFNGNTIRPSLLGSLRKLVFGPAFGGPKPTYKQWTDTINGATATLEKFSGAFLGTHVAGDSVSLADVQSFFEVTLFVEMTHYNLH